MKRNSSNSNSIEREINVILNLIDANLKEGLAVEKIRPSKGSTFCKGIINIYRKSDFERKKDDRSYKALPLESNAFYGETYKPDRIGSVAIYGEGAFVKCLALKRQGFLFGKRIISATVEQGRRPFVDVKLVA